MATQTRRVRTTVFDAPSAAERLRAFIAAARPYHLPDQFYSTTRDKRTRDGLLTESTKYKITLTDIEQVLDALDKIAEVVENVFETETDYVGALESIEQILTEAAGEDA